MERSLGARARWLGGVLAAAALSMGADGSGCGGTVSLGGDLPCLVTGCSETLCSDHQEATTCEWSPAQVCYQKYGSCGRLADGACGWQASAELDACLAQIGGCDALIVCPAELSCVGGFLYPTACGPANCDAPIGPCDGSCDPSLACVPAETCFQGSLYPTACGPANCDAAIGPCDPKCDPTMLCSPVPSCYDGLLYPSACGPFNCDVPIGPCGSTCDPSLVCPAVLTCEGGLLYPTGCGSANCDAPLGPCAAPCDANLYCDPVETCFDGMAYPTSCGPANCDAPLGMCAGCAPTFDCPAIETCEAGLLYPTGCGSVSCDPPIGVCCQALDAYATSSGCNMILGWSFDGAACVPVDCGCVGSQCDQLFPTELDCLAGCFQYF